MSSPHDDPVTVLAAEFKVPPSTIHRWLTGAMMPHPYIAERFRIRAAAVGAEPGPIPHTPAADSIRTRKAGAL